MIELPVKILFCKGKSLFSKLIRFFTGEPASHVALLVDDMWVVHSNMRGVHIESISSFIRKSEIIGKTDNIPTKLDLMEELATNSFHFYDIPAILWLGGRYLLKKIFGWKIPKVNLWQTTGLFLCTEWVTKILEGEEDSTITPYQLLLKYKDHLTHGDMK